MGGRRLEGVTIDGVTRTLKEWSRETGIDYSRLYQRIFRLGWDPKRAITERPRLGRPRDSSHPWKQPIKGRRSW